MFKKTVVLRADGNAQIGLGHIYRCIAMAEMLQDEFNCEFLLGHHSKFENVIPSQFSIKHISQEISLDLEHQWIKENYNTNSIALILDGYQDLGIKLVYIDDLCQEHMFADAVINHSPVKNPDLYKKETYTQLYLGTEYVLLRQLFLKEAQSPQNSFAGISTVLITLGGSDEHNITLKILKAVLSFKQIKTINIVIGALYKHKDSLTQIINRSTQKISLFSNLGEIEMLELMKNNDAAFAPSSTTCLEVMAVNKPLFVGYSAENQKGLHAYLGANQLIFDLQNLQKASSEELKQIILTNLDNRQEINKMLTLQKRLIDGESGSRVKNIIKNLI
ncbi:MAG: hypothetical protein K0S26_3257 [Bacteroidota bacterium]|nr:hypothetical protein [Bacteroidota bacterium]